MFRSETALWKMKQSRNFQAVGDSTRAYFQASVLREKKCIRTSDGACGFKRFKLFILGVSKKWDTYGYIDKRPIKQESDDQVVFIYVYIGKLRFLEANSAVTNPEACGR